jgi:hypothetical protein
MKIIRRYALGALLAVALACNANADSDKDKDKDKGKDKTQSVPDAGSTAALLGVSVALVELARRKIAKSGVIV